MLRTGKALLPVAIVCASFALNADAATEAERIAVLEQQLNQQKAVMQQQQRMLEAMDAELKRMKAGQAAAEPTSAGAVVVPEQAVPQEGVASVPATASAAAPAPAPARLTADLYGFVMADAIYDFKRVDPNWQDTLRVTTIPTQSGTFGNDGDVVFSVRQSRLGVRGSYGEDVTYKLEGELFGVGGG